MAFPRVSGRTGAAIDLNITFYRNGVPTDPWAVRKVSIYRSAVQPENLIAEFPVISPFESNYPAPLTREQDSSGANKPGIFHLIWDVPAEGIAAPDIFFDVWEFFPTEPSVIPSSVGVTGATGGAVIDDESLMQKCCERFWLYPDSFYCDSGLENIRLGFEPMDDKFMQPEIRTLEVGLMPLPLYDYDYNLIAPIIPNLRAFLTLMTDQCEVLINNEPMKIGIRQGTFRSNPFTLQYLFDTSRVLKGAYKYQITLQLPNGETRTSPKFSVMVS